MRIFILFLMLITAYGFMAVGNAYAQYNPSCPSVYGAKCPTGTLFIDKKIKNPQTGELVDSLSASQATFLPGQEVDFRIEVKNTGSADLTNIQVQDKFPDFIDFVSGPGNFDTNARTLNWTIDKLASGEFRLFDIHAQVQSSKSLPDLNNSCVTNFAQAKQADQVAQDTAPFCIQSKVLGATTQLPKTGPAETSFLLGGSFSLLMLSLFFFRKAHIN